MGYLERLKKSANTGGGTLKNQNNPETEGFLGSLGIPPAPFQKIEGATAANDPGQKQPLPHAAEALAAHPEAVAAEPLPDHAAPRKSARQSAQKSAAPSCKTCRHLKRPGLSAGYCGGRDDLPPAYGPLHPLRRLPDDGGASCTTWELST